VGQRLYNDSGFCLNDLRFDEKNLYVRR
jgi:hypothetical protein